MLPRRNEIALPDWFQVLRKTCNVINAVQARWDDTVHQLKSNDKWNFCLYLHKPSTSLRLYFASSLSEFLCLFYYLSLGHGQSFTWLSGVSKERHNFRLFKIYRWSASECWQCVQTRSGNCRGGLWYLVTSSKVHRKKSQSFLVKASLKDQVEKRQRSGKRIKTLGASIFHASSDVATSD